jgi:hypothetical protein
MYIRHAKTEKPKARDKGHIETGSQHFSFFEPLLFLCVPWIAPPAPHFAAHCSIPWTAAKDSKWKRADFTLKRLLWGPGMMVQVYNPSYSGGGDKRIWVQGQPGQKHETLSEQQSKQTNKQTKRTGGMA